MSEGATFWAGVAVGVVSTTAFCWSWIGRLRDIIDELNAERTHLRELVDHYESARSVIPISRRRRR